MLGFAAIVAIVGFLQTQGEKPVSHPVAGTIPALSKPEPASLLTRSDLSLTERERADILAIDGRWASDRAKLLADMSAYQPKQGTADQIRGGRQGYSQLSRDYDAARSRYWAMALAQLDARQRVLVEGGLK